MTAGNASKITDIALVKTGCSWIDSSVCSFSWGGGGEGAVQEDYSVPSQHIHKL